VEIKKSPNSKSNPEQKKKSNIGGTITLEFKLYYRAIVTKTGWYWHKNRHERSQIQNRKLRNKTTKLQYLMFDKESKNIHWRKNNLQQRSWENQYSHTKV
jgi:hypothetical protein